MTDKNINVQLIPISKLTLLENNPRSIKKEQMEKLVKSIQEDPDFIWSRPILVNHIVESNTMVVYAGNQRVRAAKKLKWKEIPCIIEENLSEDLMKKRVIKDNKTYGEFDFDVLAGDYDVDILLDCGFEEKDLGFFNEIIEEIESNDEGKEKPKQLTMCPSCGCEF